MYAFVVLAAWRVLLEIGTKLNRTQLVYLVVATVALCARFCTRERRVENSFMITRWEPLTQIPRRSARRMLQSELTVRMLTAYSDETHRIRVEQELARAFYCCRIFRPLRQTGEAGEMHSELSVPIKDLLAIVQDLRGKLWTLIAGDIERGSESLGEIVCGCNAPVVQKHYPWHFADHVLVNRNDVDASFP